MGKPKKPRLEPCLDDENSKIVYEYLKKQNRPYSATDIFNNLGGKIGKTALQKILVQLTESELISEKVYGKQSVYVVNQLKLAAPTGEEFEKLRARLVQLAASASSLKQEIKEAQSKLSQITSTPTNEELQKKVSDLKDENERVSSRSKSLKSTSAERTTEKEQEDAQKDLDTMKTLWRKRKSLFNDIWNAISESAEGNLKSLYEKIGIEDDESANVDINKLNDTLCTNIPD